MCPCNRLLGVICGYHCRRDGCRDGQHTDHCVGPVAVPPLVDMLTSTDQREADAAVQLLRSAGPVGAAQLLGRAIAARVDR